jgi:hypothetical protein
LWIANRLHTWRNVVNATPIPPISGTVRVPWLTSGIYQVVWWDTTAGQPILTQSVTAGTNGLTLTLPSALTGDIAVRFRP